MTLQERLSALADAEDVRVLMARYHQACDGWDDRGTHRDPDAIAALFTADGVWDVADVQPPPAGPAAIAALARKLQAIPWIVHMMVNPIVEVDGDTAAGEFKGLIRVQVSGSSPLVWALGLYRLTARRTPDGWRIASLSFEPVSFSERYDPGRLAGSVSRLTGPGYRSAARRRPWGCFDWWRTETPRSSRAR